MKFRIEQLNLCLLIIYLSMSIISFINEPTFINFTMDILPFTTGLIVFFLGKGWKSLTTNYYLYMCMGLFITIGGSSGNVSGALFLCFALSLRHKPKDLLKIVIPTVIAIALKIPIQSLDGYKIVNFVVMYMYLGITYYTFMKNLINKSELKLEKNYSVFSISQDVIDIVSLRIQGYSYPEINEKLELNITDIRVRRKIRDEMKRHKFKTKESFVFYLTERGIIKTFIDKPHTYG